MSEQNTDYLRKVEENYRKRYNCSQSICCAYADLLGIDEATAYRLSEGFGGGMGMQETCGAVTGMFTVLSALNSDGKPGEGQTKAATYALMREAAAKFKQEYGSLICREILKGTAPSAHDCLAKVLTAAKIIEDYRKTRGL